MCRRVLEAVIASFLFFAVLTPPDSVASAEEVATEYQIKAAFLYKFGSYVEWPEGSFDSENGTFTIGVMGADKLARYLVGMVRGRTIAGRPIVIHVLEPGQDLSGVQVLFIGRGVKDELPSILAAVRDDPVLTVTESDASRSTDSVINFVVVDNRVRFDVALASAKHRRLKISARLLEVARRVSGRSS